jgi:hypothetical protein
MPNWVYNKLTVAGANHVLDFFKEQAARPARAHDQDMDLSFLNFVRPLHTEMAWYNDTGWYEWNINNWGCKWDAGRVDILENSPRRITYYFETAWAAPEFVFKAMAEQYPELDFYLWYEEEQGWGGELVAKNGMAVRGKTWEAPSGILIS